MQIILCLNQALYMVINTVTHIREITILNILIAAESGDSIDIFCLRIHTLQSGASLSMI